MTHIQYVTGSIFDANTHVIVNTVNCRGVMGKGLALAFKERYPDMFPVYQRECKEGRLFIGRPTLYKESSPWILNFPTKDNWRANSKLEYIEKSLKYLIDHYKEADIHSIAFPQLGTQNGKLSWDEVGPLMAQYLSQLDIPVYIYIAQGDQEYQAWDEKAAKERIWKRFSEIALSLEQLSEEVQINKRDAKRIVAKCTIMPFTSIADVEGIPELAKVTLKRIKDYITSQQYKKVELLEVPAIPISPIKGKKRTRSVAKKKPSKGNDRSKENQIKALALFD